MPQRKTCKIYKTCQHVPCGEMMNRCKPSYCSKSSKNWGICNITKKECPNQRNCRMVKNRISTDQVLVTILHQKMPYIWRHLDRKTRRKMIRLARKPIRVLDIPKFID
uniref:Uncharacterized protein n=1 Tax=viral metagenome TaxID=1070528 RepID=A0A6C0D4N5_9ZZZZ